MRAWAGGDTAITVTVHLIPVHGLAVAPVTGSAVRAASDRACAAWVAPGPPLDAREEAIASERPVNAIGGAQPVEQIRLGLAGGRRAETRAIVLWFTPWRFEAGTNLS